MAQTETNTALDSNYTNQYGENAMQGKTLYDLSVPDHQAAVVPEVDTPMSDYFPPEFLRQGLTLPELSEGELVTYFTGLSQKNFSIGTGKMYPLGSCTMKYNPIRNDEVADQHGFLEVHPAQPEDTMQGSLELTYSLQEHMTEITGMKATSLAPMSGAHGELAGVKMIRAYHEDRGDFARKKMLVPDSAHGTNPASAAMAGFEVITVKSNQDGDVDQAHLDELIEKYGPEITGMMLTYPSTLGLLDKGILQIADKLHKAGGLLYGDGANTNAIMGRVKFGDLGFDVVHVNTHKALSTPHGGGGPGAGPVSVAEHLVNFLPGPVVIKKGDDYKRVDPKKSIGRLGKWDGNFGVLKRAEAYILTMGAEGLKEASGVAVLSANYIKERLRPYYHMKYGADIPCMHEVVVDGTWQKARGVNTLALSKRLEDYGFHPPTIYFPHIVEEAVMIEPTETADREALDAFVSAMIAIDQETKQNPQVVLSAPHFTPVGRLDEATAARKPVLRWKPKEPAAEPQTA